MTPSDVRELILFIAEETGWGLNELKSIGCSELFWWGQGLDNLHKKRANARQHQAGGRSTNKTIKKVVL